MKNREQKVSLSEYMISEFIRKSTQGYSKSDKKISIQTRKNALSPLDLFIDLIYFTGRYIETTI